MYFVGDNMTYMKDPQNLPVNNYVLLYYKLHWARHHTRVILEFGIDTNARGRNNVTKQSSERSNIYLSDLYCYCQSGINYLQKVLLE